MQTAKRPVVAEPSENLQLPSDNWDEVTEILNLVLAKLNVIQLYL